MNVLKKPSTLLHVLLASVLTMWSLSRLRRVRYRDPQGLPERKFNEATPALPERLALVRASCAAAPPRSGNTRGTYAQRNPAKCARLGKSI